MEAENIALLKKQDLAQLFDALAGTKTIEIFENLISPASRIDIVGVLVDDPLQIYNFNGEYPDSAINPIVYAAFPQKCLPIDVVEAMEKSIGELKTGELGFSWNFVESVTGESIAPYHEIIVREPIGELTIVKLNEMSLTQRLTIIGHRGQVFTGFRKIQGEKKIEKIPEIDVFSRDTIIRIFSDPELARDAYLQERALRDNSGKNF